jgi:hypothetical protein
MPGRRRRPDPDVNGVLFERGSDAIRTLVLGQVHIDIGPAAPPARSTVGSSPVVTDWAQPTPVPGLCPYQTPDLCGEPVLRRDRLETSPLLSPDQH